MNQTHECKRVQDPELVFLYFSSSNSPIHILKGFKYCTIFIVHGKQFLISQHGMAETFACLGEFEETQLS
jgi:hypothetical protein